MGATQNPHFIPTGRATSNLTKLPEDYSQVAGYAVLKNRSLAHTYRICCAAKIVSRLAFGRTLIL